METRTFDSRAVGYAVAWVSYHCSRDKLGFSTKKFENLDALLNVPLGINESLQQFVNERDAEKARQMNGKEERVGDW